VSARIVVFGATGITGRLVAEALVRRGREPVLAGRSAARLAELARELGGLGAAPADVSRPESVRDLVAEGDVLISTVGPFAKRGRPAIEAALAKRAHYLDSNGEPPFVREVFERHGPAAAGRGIAVLTGFGWESVPGHLAAALALRDAGDCAVRVDIGNFYSSPPGFREMSPGTRASVAFSAALPSFAYRDGAIRTVRPAERYRTMSVADRQRPAVSLGSSEHFALPRTFPQLREVNCYLGWFGRLSRPLQVLSRASLLLRLPGVRSLYEAAGNRLAGSSAAGPALHERARVTAHTAAIAYDGAGRRLAEVELAAGDGYELTGELLAWGSERIATQGLKRTGALGPVEAFGIDELEVACRELGLARVAGVA
jgi:short subunit dehydrogenase-like uncharacterized protein